VPRARSGRKHLVAVKNQVAGLIEFDPSLPRKLNSPGSANRFDCGLNRSGIDCSRFIACQPKEHGAVGSVAQAG
jgi:hypothetical protein